MEIVMQRDEAVEYVHVARNASDALVSLPALVEHEQHPANRKRKAMFEEEPRLYGHVGERGKRLTLAQTNDEVAIGLARLRQLQRNQQREDMRIEMAQIALRKHAGAHAPQHVKWLAGEFTVQRAGGPAAGGGGGPPLPPSRNIPGSRAGWPR